MKYTITYTKAFKKDFKKLSPKDQEHTLEILTRLANGESLEPKYKDHALKGEYVGCRDCHIRPDLVLIYRYNDDFLELVAMRISSHSEVF